MSRGGKPSLHSTEEIQCGAGILSQINNPGQNITYSGAMTKKDFRKYSEELERSMLYNTEIPVDNSTDTKLPEGYTVSQTEQCIAQSSMAFSVFLKSKDYRDKVAKSILYGSNEY